MKKRTIAYFNKMNALKTMSRVMDTDLTTFLNATFTVAKSNVVKKHIQLTLNSFSLPAA
jgi:hypothetical protein